MPSKFPHFLSRIVRQVRTRVVKENSSRFHFVEDYERHVAQLVAEHPIDEAMSLAVGGQYKEFGLIMAEILVQNGLQSGMSLLDLGCGSGRAAVAIGRRLEIDYLGIDIVQQLLDYAASVCPAHYKFKCHRELSIPAGDESADMLCAFSVFTHLLHEESYIYLAESYRVLKPGGTLVMSFLEFADSSHWAMFEPTVDNRKKGIRIPLNMFIERNAIAVWCSHLGFECTSFLQGWETRLGQTVAILHKPSSIE